MNKNVWYKSLVVVVIFLFVGVSSSASINVPNDQTSSGLPVDKAKNSSEDGGIKIIFPENGIYWNLHKILPFCCPVILHGKLLIVVGFESNTTSGYVEFYVNGVLQYTIPPPGPYEWTLTGGMFTKLCITAKCGIYSDTITVWWIFP